jgi:hypothetical protein
MPGSRYRPASGLRPRLVGRQPVTCGPTAWAISSVHGRRPSPCRAARFSPPANGRASVVHGSQPRRLDNLSPSARPGYCWTEVRSHGRTSCWWGSGRKEEKRRSPGSRRSASPRLDPAARARKSGRGIRAVRRVGSGRAPKPNRLLEPPMVVTGAHGVRGRYRSGSQDGYLAEDDAGKGFPGRQVSAACGIKGPGSWSISDAAPVPGHYLRQPRSDTSCARLRCVSDNHRRRTPDRANGEATSI